MHLVYWSTEYNYSIGLKVCVCVGGGGIVHNNNMTPPKFEIASLLLTPPQMFSSYIHDSFPDKLLEPLAPCLGKISCPLCRICLEV